MSSAKWRLFRVGLDELIDHEQTYFSAPKGYFARQNPTMGLAPMAFLMTHRAGNTKWNLSVTTTSMI